MTIVHFWDNEVRDYCIFQNKTLLEIEYSFILQLKVKTDERYRPVGSLV